MYSKAIFRANVNTQTISMNTKYLNFEDNYNKNIEECSTILKNGGIGIFPTDTVYGIGCVFSNTSSINNLYKVKNRNYNKPIAVLISNIDMLFQNMYKLDDKKIKNGLMESLIKVFNLNKRSAREMINSLDIPLDILEIKFSDIDNKSLNVLYELISDVI